MITGTIDHNSNITIFVYVLAQQFNRIFFDLKLPEGWKVKISDIVNSSLNLAETKFYAEGLAPPFCFDTVEPR